MRKLCFAVIVLSFIGFGPLKSFFHNDKGFEGKSTNGIPIIETLKNSSGFLDYKQKVKNFLITEVSSENNAPRAALLLSYDKDKNKLKVGSISSSTVGSSNSFNIIKKAVEKNYQLTIDHCFIFDPSRMGQIIDLLAPNGITLTFENKDLNQLKTNHLFNGEELIRFIEQVSANPNNQRELNAVFLALKTELSKINHQKNGSPWLLLLSMSFVKV